MSSAETAAAVTRPSRLSPGERVEAQPWAFIGLALAAGLAAGLLWRYKTLRKALGVYLVVRRFV